METFAHAVAKVMVKTAVDMAVDDLRECRLVTASLLQRATSEMGRQRPFCPGFEGIRSVAVRIPRICLHAHFYWSIDILYLHGFVCSTFVAARLSISLAGTGPVCVLVRVGVCSCRDVWMS